MRKVFLFLASLSLGIGVLVWIYKIIGWNEIMNAFLVFSGWQGLTIFLLSILIAIVGNWKWLIILKGKEIKISFFDLFKYYLAGFSIIFLAPILFGGGEFLKVYILKKKNPINWSKVIASVIIDRISEWTTNLLVIFSGILIFLYKVGLPPRKLTLVFGMTLLFFSMGLFYFYLKTLRKESFVKSFGRFFNQNLDSKPLEAEKEIFSFFKLENSLMWKSFILSILKAGVMYLRTLFLIIFLQKKISLLSTFSIFSFTCLAAMIPIPASLGSHEALQIFAFKSLGISQSTAAVFTFILRGVDLLIALIGILVLIRLGLFLVKDNIFQKMIFNFNKNNKPK